MLRIAAAEDLTALTRLRRAATGDSAEDAAGWLQRVAGLENILLLEKPGAPPALMLAENQSLDLGAGRRCGYGMIAFLHGEFPVTDVYFRMLL